jgi:hypothetical protein
LGSLPLCFLITDRRVPHTPPLRVGLGLPSLHSQM